jgi:hypothetical protein
MDHQVRICTPSISISLLMPVLDFATARYLQQELSAHCEFHFPAFCSRGVDKE